MWFYDSMIMSIVKLDYSYNLQQEWSAENTLLHSWLC